MKLEVKMIERKEQLTELHPFNVENTLWGTRAFSCYIWVSGADYWMMHFI